MPVQSARDAGLPIGFYYSPPDMSNSNFRDTSKLAKDTWHGDPERPQWSQYLDDMAGPLHELLTNDGPVAVIWFDGLDCPYKYNPWRMLPLLHSLQANTLVNDRLGLPGDFGSSAFEEGVPKGIPTTTGALEPLTYGNRASLSRSAPAAENFRLWEECMTINGTIRLSGLNSSVSRVRLLATHGKLQFSQDGTGVSIHVPAKAPDPYDSVIEIQMR